MTAHLLHHLLEVGASTRPEGEAVVDRERSITYGELDRRANQLAHLLVELGVGRGDRVGLYLAKSLESVLGIFAILKAGAAYVPLDPQAPVARLAFIAADCGIRCLLSEKQKSRAWQELRTSGAPLETVVVLNGDGVDDAGPGPMAVIDISRADSHPVSAPELATIDLDLAYILYTSGSTGAPKGVMLSHLNAITFVNWGVDRFSLNETDRLSSHAPLHFDLSVFDIFAAAASGAAIVLVPPQISVFPVEVVRFIERNRITVWYSVPSILTMMTLRAGLVGGELPTLRAVLFAGEVFPTKYLRQLMALLPHVRFHNLYGPTETNVCTHYEVPVLPDDQAEAIPIGRAITDVEVFAVTDDGRRAEPGEVGELLVRGTTVMNGYWGDPERTARGLVPNPFGQGSADQAYRTGDIVREDASGDYRFLGRRDAQIKSRGYRIELGEIETALYAHPSVVECAVIAVPDEVISNKIKAYVVVKDGAGEKDLVRSCTERIPRYMLPEEFEFRESLPKTSTGKIDRQNLLAAGRKAPAE